MPIYMTRVEAIKKYLEADGPGSVKGSKVENRDIMGLSKDARHELGAACLAALGAELKEV